MVFLIVDGKARQVTVTTGIQDDTYIELTDGVSIGDKVVSAPYSAISRKLDDNDEVEIVDKEDLYEKKD